ncbi:MAG: PD40 domain-containing protein [Planctomycetes bacterium]|nr:PD40 domain-containing protein [Planctomycetota bacterium]MCW8134115.1 PD40 domain-containing protein [Planctomycetota bacterium]
MKYAPALAAVLCLLLVNLSLAQRGPDIRPNDRTQPAAVASQILRQPALSPDGATLAFVYDGDIWSVPGTGGTARRLTITAGNDGDPAFSPDGKWLAFRSARTGSDSIYVMPAEGGEARRLTWGDSSDQPCCWLPDSTGIIFSSARREGARDLWVVRLAGGEPWPITGGGYGTHELGASISPDGKKIAYVNRGGDPLYRRGYNGTSNSEVWICDFDGATTRNHARLTANRSHNHSPVFVAPDQIMYVTYSAGAASQRVAQLACMNTVGRPAAGFNLPANTDARDLAVGGGKFVYSSGANGRWHLYVGELGRGGAGKVMIPPIKLATDRRDAGVRVLTHTTAGEYAVSPDGKKLAFTAGGDVFVMPADEEGVPLQLTDTLQEEKNLAWSIDSTRVLFTTAIDGSLHMVDASNPGAGITTLIMNNAFHNSSLAVDPAGRVWSVQDDARIVMLRNDPAWGAAKDAPAPAHARFDGRFYGWALGRGGIEFSPDGKWILYTQPNELYNGQVVLAEIATGTVHPVSHLFGSATTARFAPDGKRVVFANNQEQDYDVYVVELEPKLPEFKEEKLDKLFKREDAKDEAKPAARGPKPPPETRLVSDGIKDRVRRISSLAGSEFWPVALSDGKTFCFVGNVEGQANIWKLVLDPDKGPDLKQLTQSRTTKSALTLSTDEKTLWWLEAGKVTSMPVAGGKISTYNFSVTQRRDALALRREAFREMRFVMGRYFYDRGHHGIDWNETCERYGQALNSVSTGQEFGSLMNELLGELNSSHQGFSAWDNRSDGMTESCGWLGVRFDAEQLRQGRYRVIEVVKGGPFDLYDQRPPTPFWLVGVNGKELKPGDTLAQHLEDTIGKRTVLTVNDQLVFQGAPTVAVKPISRGAESQLWYQRWVEWQREMVEKLSEGRLGYVHIRAMNQSAVRDFKHHLGNAMLGKEGVVLDVRFNGGGSTAVDLLEILMKRPWLKRQYGDREDVSENIYRSVALEKPSILLINEHSFSNAEIMAEGYRRLGIGKIVGVETAGGVIGTGSHRLIDGSSMRLPSTGAFTIDGENLENNGRKPDIAVENHPDALDKGVDAQTERAVKELLNQLKRK